ncbi:IQ domain-containing protein F2-like [Phodopus roborovskii]|uniref:IQ domain-containing protein F2-like n=1 Tax=Phodopus roborovskii TaxID=109678 RepID=UPI0021E4010C|nr:IQ domain-containing protein F2-like [Phodopus roborovskii]
MAPAAAGLGLYPFARPTRQSPALNTSCGLPGGPGPGLLGEQQRLLGKKKLKRKKAKAAIKIQAWWRGTLVRRTLLHAALRAWIIQCWWRLTLRRVLEKKRRKALIDYSQRERAVVKLQSLIRMWRIYWRYCQVLSAIYIIQAHWKYHNCQSCSFLRGHCVITTTHLQFHIEIIDH